MADEELQVGVKITADVAGAQQADTALKSVKRTTDASQVSTSALRQAVMRLTAQFPLLRNAMLFAFNPLTALAGVLSLAMLQVKEALADVTEEIKTQAEWDAYGRAAREALEAGLHRASAFRREMERIKTETLTASEAAQQMLKMYEAQMSAQQRLDAAQKKLEEAKAGAEKDPVRRAQKLLQVEERYAALEVRRKNEAAGFELARLQMTLKSEKATVDLLDKELERARQHDATLKSEKEIEERLAHEKALLDEVNKKLAYYRGQKIPSIEALEVPQLEVERAKQEDVIRRLEVQRVPGIEAKRTAAEEIADLEARRKAAAKRARDIELRYPAEEGVAIYEERARGRELATGAAARAASAATEARTAAQTTAREIEANIRAGVTVQEESVRLLREQTRYYEELLGRVKAIESQLANQRNR